METDGFQGERGGHDCGGARREGEGGDGRRSGDGRGDGRGEASGEGKEDEEEEKEEIHITPWRGG